MAAGRDRPRIGYALSSEEHPPLDLVRHAAMAEERGFEFALIERAAGTAGRLGIAIAAATVEGLTERDKPSSDPDAEPSADAL